MSVSKNLKTVLIQGGWSVEREISLMSARSAAQALNQLNISFTSCTADITLYSRLQKLKPDRVFLAVHGPYGEDGSVQGMLEYLKIPYTGSGVLASALCMDKAAAKKRMKAYKIQTPFFVVLQCEKKESSKFQWNAFWDKKDQHKISQPFLDLFSAVSNKAEDVSEPPFIPCVVKPNRSGSSIGIRICRSKGDWKAALNCALEVDFQVIVEEYIEGSELAVSWLNGKILTPVEISPRNNHFYDFKRKYEKDQTDYFIPSKLKADLVERAGNWTEAICRNFQLRTYGRVDFIVDRLDQIYALEVNTLPGLTSVSLLPMSAQYDGISYNQLILKILEGADLDYKVF